MSRATDRFLDLLRDSQWATPSWKTTVIIEHVTDEMTIVPESKDGPMLRIASKDKDGSVLHTREMNLAAVDGMIGTLIKMRDLMSQIKGDDK